RGPHGLAVTIDGDAVGAAPRASVDVRPVADDAIRVRAGVDGLDLVGLRRAAARLRVNAAPGERNADGDQHGGAESRHGADSTCLPGDLCASLRGFGITIRPNIKGGCAHEAVADTILLAGARHGRAWLGPRPRASTARPDLR